MTQGLPSQILSNWLNDGLCAPRNQSETPSADVESPQASSGGIAVEQQAHSLSWGTERARSAEVASGARVRCNRSSRGGWGSGIWYPLLVAISPLAPHVRDESARRCARSRRSGWVTTRVRSGRAPLGRPPDAGAASSKTVGWKSSRHPRPFASLSKPRTPTLGLTTVIRHRSNPPGSRVAQRYCRVSTTLKCSAAAAITIT